MTIRLIQVLYHTKPSGSRLLRGVFPGMEDDGRKRSLYFYVGRRVEAFRLDLQSIQRRSGMSSKGTYKMCMGAGGPCDPVVVDPSVTREI